MLDSEQTVYDTNNNINNVLVAHPKDFPFSAFAYHLSPMGILFINP